MYQLRGEQIMKNIDLLNAPESEIREAVIKLPKNGTKKPLWPHQSEAVDNFFRNNAASGIFHLPTGAGKTRIAIELIARLKKSNPNHPVIWVSYPRILIRQAMINLYQLGYLFPKNTCLFWRNDPVIEEYEEEIYNDVLNNSIILTMRDTLTELFDCASVKTYPNALLKKLLSKKKADGLTIIYDECHQLGAAQLQKQIKRYVKNRGTNIFNKIRFIGLSATPLPTNQNAHKLYQELLFPVKKLPTKKPEWNMMVHAEVDNRTLIKNGTLCPINLDIHHSGDFLIPTELVLIDFETGKPANIDKRELFEFEGLLNNEVMSDGEVLQFLSMKIAENFDKLGKTLVFVPTIKAANYLTNLLGKDKRVGKGNVTVVHSKLNEFSSSDDLLDDEHPQTFTEVHKHIEAFKKRGSKPTIMINVGMLTTGFDDPKIQTVILARATFSTNLFWQMIGRGTRGPKAGGTEYCNVIDPVNLTGKFEVFNGYRPQLDVEYNERLSDLIDDIGDKKSELDPHIPEYQEDNDSEMIIDKAFNKEMTTILKSFIKDCLEDATVLKEVIEKCDFHEVTNADVGYEVQIKPRKKNSEINFEFIITTMVNEVEDHLRKINPHGNFSFLDSPEIIPSIKNDKTIIIAQERLKKIRDLNIMSIEEYYTKAF